MLFRQRWRVMVAQTRHQYQNMNNQNQIKYPQWVIDVISRECSTNHSLVYTKCHETFCLSSKFDCFHLFKIDIKFNFKLYFEINIKQNINFDGEFEPWLKSVNKIITNFKYDIEIDIDFNFGIMSHRTQDDRFDASSMGLFLIFDTHRQLDY